MVHAQPVVSTAKAEAEGRRALLFYAKVFLRFLPHDNRLHPVLLLGKPYHGNTVCNHKSIVQLQI